MNTKRHALGLAAVLAATVLTGGAAVLGLTHTSAPAAAPAAVAQAAPATSSDEGGD